MPFAIKINVALWEQICLKIGSERVNKAFCYRHGEEEEAQVIGPLTAETKGGKDPKDKGTKTGFVYRFSHWAR